MKRKALLDCGMLSLALCLASAAHAQDLQDRATPVPPPMDQASPEDPDQIQFTANQLDYDNNTDVVTATGDVRLYRQGQRLRAEKVVWNRKTGQVLADGNVVTVSPEGDTAYGDHVELTDTLKDGVIENLLVVMEGGGRIAAEHGERKDGIFTVTDAAYTPCAVATSAGCPKEPSWKVTAKKVVYDPQKGRMHYTGARVSVLRVLTIPLPAFSHPVGGNSDSGLLSPSLRYNGSNGAEVAVPYFFSFSPSRDLTVTPHVYSKVLPMLQGEYRQLDTLGAFRITAYATASRRTENLVSTSGDQPTEYGFRGYIDATGRYQLDPNWSISGSLRITTDRTFLKRYDISNDDRLRSNISIERIDADSYFAINGWAVQTLRVGDTQKTQPIALPEIDYRRRFDEGLLGGKIEMELNTLALTRDEGQDTQRAFASLRWDLRKVTPGGQEVIFTAYARADAYNTQDTAATDVLSYRGLEGFQGRAIGALAAEIRWPLIGPAFGGTQQITPRFQVVASPHLANLTVPNEDSRSIDLDESNLFALNRFAGYDRFEDSTRVTYGLEYALYLPGVSIDAVVGQSYRLNDRASILPDGTGLSDRLSDIVGRTEVRFHDFVSFTHRYRLDKDGFAVRRNEIDTTVGSRATYVTVGYLRLNRDIDTTEDLQDREEVRIGGRVQFARFWSAYGSTLIDLTDHAEDSTSTADGFEPVRHRIGVQYEDDCLRIGFTWRRDYSTTGDATGGDGYLLTLAFKNLGR